MRKALEPSCFLLSLLNLKLTWKWGKEVSGFCMNLSQFSLAGEHRWGSVSTQNTHSVLKFSSLASLKEVETSHLTMDLFAHQKISNNLTKEFTDRLKKRRRKKERRREETGVYDLPFICFFMGFEWSSQCWKKENVSLGAKYVPLELPSPHPPLQTWVIPLTKTWDWVRSWIPQWRSAHC